MLAAFGAGAAEPPADPPEPTPETTTAPSAELLLFLGEFADADGEFVDPGEIDAAQRREAAAARAAPRPAEAADHDDDAPPDPDR